MGHRDRQYHQEYGIGNFKAEPGALHQHSDGHFHPAEREQTISVLHPAHGCHQGRDFTAPANQRQHVGAGLSFHVVLGQLPTCTAFQYRQQKKQCPHSPMDCRAGCRARFQELHPPHRYGHLPQPLSEGVHPSGYQHLLPARLRHRRGLLAQARHPS